MEKRSRRKVSFVTTEYNEEKTIGPFIDSLLSQSLVPDEIIITDAGSTDGTIDIINQKIAGGAPITLLVAPGNRSVGRNAAIRAAKNEIIAVSDAGCKLDKNWLKNITQPFEDTKVGAVAGFYKVVPKTYFETVSTDFIFHVNDNINLDEWLPSSRSIAFTKSAWKAAGGYPEFREYGKSKIALKCGGEDTLFDLSLKRAGYKFANGLSALVYWRPRSSLIEFFKQYYMYSLGDGIQSIDRNHYEKLFARYFLSAVLILATVISGQGYLLWSLLLVFLALLSRRVIRPWLLTKDLKAFPIMVALAFTFDTAQLSGYSRGYIERMSIPKSKRRDYVS